jgi:hypothetical protein
LADALRQSESASGFDWDIALNLGDISGDVGLPKDSEGEEIVRQFGALKKHRREQIYDLSGNHDRSGLNESQAWWWRKWIDPTGEHTDCSSDAIQEGFNVLLGRLDEQFSIRIPTHVLSEKIKAVLHVRNDCLCRRKFKPSFLQELLDEGLDLTFQ